MKKALWYFLLFCLECSQFLLAQALDSPETIVYDSLRNCYYASSYTYGHIVKIDSEGNMSYYYTQYLASTFGLHIDNDILYIASNNGLHPGVVGIDLETASEVFYVKPPESDFFNDITTDTSGYLYYTDTGGNRIYKVSLATGDYTILTQSVTWPNGIFFDRRNNRLIVASNVLNSYLYAINTETGEKTNAVITPGQYDGMDEDNLHNLYASYSDEGTVYMFDSTLANDGVIVSSGHIVPEGIHFNKLNSILCIPNMFGNTIDYLRRNVDIWCSADTMGWAPFTTNLIGESVFDITQWDWDFGDGTTSQLQNPQHTFDPGKYDIKLTGITSGGDTLYHIFPHYIFSLADTLWFDSINVDLSNTYSAEATLNLKNSVPVKELTIPITYAGQLFLSYNSYTIEGCRITDSSGIQILDNDVSSKRITFLVRLRPHGDLFLPPGDGPLLKLRFSALGSKGQQNDLIISNYGSDTLSALAISNSFTPATYPGRIYYGPNCGDANGDGSVNIVDASFIINYIFFGGSAPAPVEAGDANNDGSTNIVDASYIVNYIFFSGPAPCAG